MFSTLRNRFGIPGVISVIALVFAMFGGAYAASNSSGGGKATASAKAKQGPRGKTGKTGPAGPAGPAGPVGPAGAKGDAGTAGSNGTNGTNGAPGQSVSASAAPPEPAHCEEGGSKFVVGASTTYACNGANGADGSPWTLNGKLPVGSTETGNFALGSESGTGIAFGYAFDAISFNVPLQTGLDATHAIYVSASGGNPTCTGSSGNPIAPSGYLCVYEGFSGEMGSCEVLSSGLGAGTDPSGANIGCLPEGAEASAIGTWAVTG
jgi:hypothetical protein